MTLTLAEAVAALRAGRPVRVGETCVVAVETGSPAMLALVDGDGAGGVLLSGERAAALGLGNRRAVADGSAPVRVTRADWMDRDTVRALVDAGQDGARAPKGPLQANAAQEGDDDIVRLLRLAGLLPAAWIVEVVDAPAIDLDTVRAARRTMDIVSRAALPLDGVDNAQMVAFRDAATGAAHVALIVGDGFGGEPPLIRIHDECLTGDVFGSLKCDCGPQLDAALRLIAASGAGILLYLRQEGRGIGIANKLRAYALQDRGLDTVDANRRLGFADDERDFGIAAAMLRALKVDAVRLLTNNPRKVAGLEEAGISVVERVAHHMPTNPHNADYIATKRDRSGHLA